MCTFKEDQKSIEQPIFSTTQQQHNPIAEHLLLKQLMEMTNISEENFFEREKVISELRKNHADTLDLQESVGEKLKSSIDSSILNYEINQKKFDGESILLDKALENLSDDNKDKIRQYVDEILAKKSSLSESLSGHSKSIKEQIRDITNPRISEQYVKTITDQYREASSLIDEYAKNITIIREAVEREEYDIIERISDVKLELESEQEKRDYDETQRELDELKKEDIKSRKRKNTSRVKITHTQNVKKGYVPKDALGKIKAFTDYEGNTVEGVGKIQGMFGKQNLGRTGMKDRMRKHVMLYLSNNEGVTDKTMMESVRVLINSSNLKDKAEKKEKTKLIFGDKIKLDLIFKVLDIKKDYELKEILGICKEYAAFKKQDISKELAFNSSFFKEHPDSAKVIILYKLLNTISTDESTDKATQEIRDRVYALRENIRILYDALVASEDYQNALRKQKIRILERKLSNGKNDDTDRENFEEEAKKLLTEEQWGRYDKLEDDAKSLFFVFLTNEVSRDMIPVTDGSGALEVDFINGELLSKHKINIDYNKLLEKLKAQKKKIKNEVIDGSLIRIEELVETKMRKEIFDSTEYKEDPIITKDIHHLAEKAISTKEDWTKEFKANPRLTNRKKLWTLYTVLRPFDMELNKLRDAGNLSDKEERLLRDYDELKKYAGLLKTQSGWAENTLPQEKEGVIAQRQEIENYFSDALGLYGTVEEDEERENIDKNITFNLYAGGKSREKAQGELEVEDKDELNYPPDVIEAVKRIDKWIAINSTEIKGDSKGHFAHELLGHPFRERLFIYYVIENNKYDAPTELDAACALNGYVPDYKKFKKTINKWKIHLIDYTATGLKHSKKIRESGYLDTLGYKHTDKIEKAMRTLDDQRFNMQGKLKDLSEEINTAVKEDLPRSVRVREACYFSLVSEIAKQKKLLGEKRRDKKAVSLQADAVMRALNRLISADDDVSKDQDSLRITKEKIEELKSEREKAVTPESHKVTKGLYYASYVGYGGALIADTVAGAVKGISDIDLEKRIKLVEYGIKPWHLSEGGNQALFASREVFKSVAGLSSLLTTLIVIKNNNVFDSKKSFTEKIVSGMNILERLGYTADTVCDLVGYIAPTVADTAESFGGYAVAGVQIVTGGVKAAIAVGRKVEVHIAEKSSLKYADKRQEDTNDPNAISNDELRESISNVAKLQQRTLTGEAVTGSITCARGCLSVIGMTVPYAGLATEPIDKILLVTKTIYSFWKSKNTRNKTIDDYIHLDDLYKNFMYQFNLLPPEIQDRYIPKDKRSKGKIRDMLRKEAFNKMHYSTKEEFFMDVTRYYANVLYKEIFFTEDNKPIYRENKEERKKRRPLRYLFPGLRFTYPKKAGDRPKPSPADLVKTLTRGT